MKNLIVIKIGGRLLKSDVLPIHLREIVVLSKKGYRVVVIHGGGQEINEKLEALGKKPRFVKGQRYTDQETLEIVEMVLAGINKRIVGMISRLGGKACGLSGKDGFLVEAKKSATEYDLGYVGEAEKVNAELIRILMSHRFIPVISSIGMDRKGTTYNINADVFAAQLSSALQAERLVFLTDVPGLLSDPEDENSVIPLITVTQLQTLLDRGVIREGMIPKIDSCIQGLKKGIKEMVILDGRRRDALFPFTRPKMRLRGTLMKGI